MMRPRKRLGKVMMLILALAFIAAPSAFAADVLIDTFAYTTVETSYQIPESPTFPVTEHNYSGSGVAEVLGGQRDLCLTITGGNQNAYARLTADADNDYLSMALDPSVKATAVVQWDGASNTDCALDATGLQSGGEGQDLTGGGTNGGVLLRVVASDSILVVITVRIYTDGTNYAEQSVNFQAQVQSPSQAVDMFMLFDDFDDISGTMAVTDVGAVELEMDATADESAGADITIKMFKATSVYEYGDLPTYYGNDILNARHIVLLTMRLGASLDAEANHHASTLARGDDDFDFDDEDGVLRRNRNGTVPSGDPNWSPGETGDDGKVRIAAKDCGEAAACYIVGWIDWNRDGDFDDSLEKVVEKADLTSDTETNYGFEIPAGTSFTNVRYFARFRICPAIWHDEAGWLPGDCSTPTATDIRNGETEDYAWDWGTPTAVELTSFTATGQAGHVLLTWETASEIDNIGFNLYRRQFGTEAYGQLNAAFIPALEPGQTQGHRYSFRDETVAAGTTYEYLLEDVDSSGVRTARTPVRATALYTIYLPLVMR